MSLYVDELFQELSQLPPDEREAAIASRCAHDPAAEAQVRALLSAEARLPRTLRIDVGTELGPYRLERKLGEGATASVWQAWDTHLRAYTALKLLHPENVRGDGALRVVLHEARAASSIISDHVVRIKTAGRLDGGPPFIEMELCAEYEPSIDGSEALTTGQSLSEVALSSLAEKVRVVAEAAQGVEAAHRIGVLHRDLKPGNILLTPVSRRAKVTDFGLAADQVYPAPTSETGVARTVTVQTTGQGGAIVGTPAYMPPEQARGESPSRATDVYGLGATLYALIVGDHPYLARPNAAVPALDVLEQVKRGPPERLRRRAHVPRRLARIVERAMARAPRQRYATAAALASDLEAWLGGFPTSHDSSAPWLRAGLFIGRHRTAAATVGALLVVLLVVAGAVALLEQRRRDLTSAIGEAQVTMADYRRRAIDFEQQVAVAAEQLTATKADLDATEAARQQALLSESAAEQRYRLEVENRNRAIRRARTAEAALAATAQARADALAELAAAVRDLGESAADNEALRARRLELESQLAEVQETADALNAEVAALTEALAGAQTELAAAQAALSEAESRLASLPPDPTIDMGTTPADEARVTPLIEAPPESPPAPPAESQ